MQRRQALLTAPLLLHCLTHPTMSSSTEDTLHPPDRLKYELGVAEEQTSGHARVRVTLLGNGAQPKYPGSRLTVNGHALEEKPLSKQGVWYTAEVPLAPTYDFAFNLADGHTVMAHRQTARTFSTQLPAEVSRSRGVQLPFLLKPALPTDGIELEFRPERPMDGDSRTLRVKPRLEEGRLIVAAADLLRLPSGPADLLVGLYGGTSRQGAISLRYAVLHRGRVVVTD